MFSPIGFWPGKVSLIPHWMFMPQYSTSNVICLSECKDSLSVFSALSSIPDFLVNLSYCLNIPWILSLSAPQIVKTSSAYTPYFNFICLIDLGVTILIILISLLAIIFLFRGSILMLKSPFLKASPCLNPFFYMYIY